LTGEKGKSGREKVGPELEGKRSYGDVRGVAAGPATGEKETTILDEGRRGRTGGKVVEKEAESAITHRVGGTR